MILNPFIIDCDTGRDDALAIWICLNLKLPLKAVISSYGNTVLDNVIENNRRVLQLGNGVQDVALFNGFSGPSQDHKAHREIVLPRQEMSGNGLCNLELPKVPDEVSPGRFSAFADKISREGPVDYIITGPATNLAALLMDAAPRLKNLIGTVTMMGGKLEPLWSQIPGADFNLACDPFAIQIIFENDIPIRFVPMDATWPIAITLEEIEKLEPSGAIAKTTKALMIAHCRNFATEPIFRFHDPAVIMACLHPESFEDEKMRIELEETSPDFGRLVPDENGYRVQIFRPDNETRARFLADMLEILGLKQPA